jgi:uncharacterized membrane protein
VITHPVLLSAALVAVVVAVLNGRRAAFLRPLYRFLPAPFWCYFIPMLLCTAGVFPESSPVYGWASRYVLTGCLALLLVGMDLKSLAAMGRPAARILAAGMGAVALGGIVSFAVWHHRLPPESWKVFGALTGSWTGGSANLLAVKEALQPPEAVFAPIVVVDTLLAYSWMAFAIFLAGFQDRFDRWNRAEYPAGLDGVARPAGGGKPFRAVALAAAVAALALWAGDRLPALGAVVTRASWTVLLVTTLSLLVAAAGLAAREGPVLEKWGSAILYILLASLGARVKVTALMTAPAFLAAGVTWMAVFALALLAAGRWLRAPLGLLAAVSQACVGGPISAPVVAAVHRPSLAPVALMMALAGNAVGTYVGLAVAYAARAIAG